MLLRRFNIDRNTELRRNHTRECALAAAIAIAIADAVASLTVAKMRLLLFSSSLQCSRTCLSTAERDLEFSPCETGYFSKQLCKQRRNVPSVFIIWRTWHKKVACQRSASFSRPPSSNPGSMRIHPQLFQALMQQPPPSWSKGHRRACCDCKTC